MLRALFFHAHERHAHHAHRWNSILEMKVNNAELSRKETQARKAAIIVWGQDMPQRL